MAILSADGQPTTGTIMTDKTQQPGAAAPGTIAIDPRVALEEQAALAEFWRNRALYNGQRAFEHAAAINTVQDATAKVVAENDELRKAAEQPVKAPKPDKKVN
ncbi:MAG: hypothetical protein ACTHKQ_21880 [Mesorhizobium sp.]